LKSGEGTSWMFENRLPHMLVEDKTVYSALTIIVKDIVSSQISSLSRANWLFRGLSLQVGEVLGSPFC